MPVVCIFGDSFQGKVTLITAVIGLFYFETLRNPPSSDHWGALVVHCQAHWHETTRRKRHKDSQIEQRHSEDVKENQDIDTQDMERSTMMSQNDIRMHMHLEGLGLTGRTAVTVSVKIK